ncbi:hypothetical protein FRC04_003310 [Tulasnella sp. 424]|nr:hypothetical protein FRC04_003310 [Tulasnella sp. 424]
MMSAIRNEVTVSAYESIVKSDLKELASPTAYNGANYRYNYAATTTRPPSLPRRLLLPSRPPLWITPRLPPEEARATTTAPKPAVLRYFPFDLDASVGGTVRFVSGGGSHTVTKSSALNHASPSAHPSSDPQNKNFVLDQKGMFVAINPPNAEPAAVDSTTKVGSHMQSLTQTDSSTAAALWSYISNQTAGTTAENWGMQLDDRVPIRCARSEHHVHPALYAANPSLSNPVKVPPDINGSGTVIPADITSALQNLAASGPATSSACETVSLGCHCDFCQRQRCGCFSASGSPYTTGSGRLAPSTVLVGAIAVLASFCDAIR